MKRFNVAQYVVFFGFLLVTIELNALESDLLQPIEFTSDFAVVDHQKGTTTYSGEVVIERGSMRIAAEKVTVYFNEAKSGSVTKIVAQGTPASYQQMPKENDDLIIAKANTLEYSFKDESLHLIDSASLTQGGTSLTGNRIDYDAKNSIMKAGLSIDKKERIKMVVPPKALQKKTAE